jgi:hypothetical protein
MLMVLEGPVGLALQQIKIRITVGLAFFLSAKKINLFVRRFAPTENIEVHRTSMPDDTPRSIVGTSPNHAI